MTSSHWNSICLCLHPMSEVLVSLVRQQQLRLGPASNLRRGAPRINAPPSYLRKCQEPREFLTDLFVSGPKSIDWLSR